MLYVQFTDTSKTEILSIFGSPQDEEVYPNQGQVELSDPLYKAYYEAQPSIAQMGLPVPAA
jgi:hypothetical protein